MRFLICLLVLLFSLKATAQLQLLPVVENQFDQSAKVYGEWVYCQLNKNDFEADEALFFQGYILKEREAIPSPLATNLIVEILDAQQKVVRQGIYYIKNGIAPGQVLLSNLPVGHYTFRAYTNWMRNFALQAAYESDFRIVGPTKAIPAPLQSAAKTSLQLHVEGNTALANVEQKWYLAVAHSGMEELAMRISDALGKVILEQDVQEKVTSFYFTPPTAGAYTCTVHSKAGKILAHTVMPVRDTGLTLAANVFEPGQLAVHLQLKQDSSAEASYFMAIHGQGQLFAMQKVRFNALTANLRLSTKELKSGVYHISIFNEAGTLAAERPFFVHNSDTSVQPWSITAGGDMLSLSPSQTPDAQQSWEYSLTILPNADLYRQYNFDAFEAYYKLLNLPWSTETHMDRADFAQQLTDLDNQLQCYYSRGFAWDNIVKQNQSTYPYSYEQGFQIKGQLKDFDPKKDVDKGTAILNSVDNSFSLTSPVNEKGQFSFDKLYLLDSSRVYLSAEVTRGKNWNRKITVDTIRYQYPIRESIVDARPLKEWAISQQKELPIKKLNLEEVAVKMKQKTNRNLYGGVNDDVFIINEQSFKKYNSILDVLRSRFMLQINEMARGTLEIKFRGGMLTMDPTGGLQSNNPAIVIDGMLTNDMNVLRDLQITDLEEIAINKDGINLLGPSGANGAIFLKTRTRGLNLEGSQLDAAQSRFNTFLTKGYTLPKAFKASGQVGDKSAYDESIACLHWQTGTVSAKAPKIDIDRKLYQPGAILILQGIDNKGNIISQKYIAP